MKVVLKSIASLEKYSNEAMYINNCLLTPFHGEILNNFKRTTNCSLINDNNMIRYFCEDCAQLIKRL